ncbi:hypothetical protein [Xylophilus sp. GOD-11R]|uniref:hypothetical protein n=1 Tax=Xylophilus sp. GOD-11R TaxID=3089814 RepID=UPI00298C0AEB|nr:hypothetical protein [Xylophilus sp. GOD-11R]WPB58067.1 hypothetical protein R9X41_05345 [Xylophilus sp. GOD-11R]
MSEALVDTGGEAFLGAAAGLAEALAVLVDTAESRVPALALGFADVAAFLAEEVGLEDFAGF